MLGFVLANLSQFLKKKCLSKCGCHGLVKFNEKGLAIPNCYQTNLRKTYGLNRVN